MPLAVRRREQGRHAPLVRHELLRQPRQIAPPLSEDKGGLIGRAVVYCSKLCGAARIDARRTAITRTISTPGRNTRRRCCAPASATATTASTARTWPRRWRIWARAGERDTVRSQINKSCLHFLKLAYSPARDPRFDWMDSITEARFVLARTDSRPPCAATAEEALSKSVYATARKRAAVQFYNYPETTNIRQRSLCRRNAPIQSTRSSPRIGIPPDERH